MKRILFISNSRINVFFRRGIAIVVSVSLIILGCAFLQELTRVKTTGNSRDMLCRSYFDDPEQYDVLFLGTSHVLYGINPLEIWHEYGITSYNWGSPTCTIPTIYWKLINILDYHTPKLVVVDCFRATWEQKTYSETRIHEALDAFPLSVHKYQAVRDLMDGQPRKEDGLVYTKQEQINVLVPLSAYHSRWENLEQDDFAWHDMDTKGAEIKTSVGVPIEISDTSDKTDITKSMQGIIYLKRIIEECQSRNIDILLTYLPFPTSEPWKMEANVIKDIADEYGADYLDCTRENVVNYSTDCNDSESHLNVSGAEKVSRYIGNYIVDNYDISAKFSDDAISRAWETKYDKYREFRERLVLSQSSLASYLMLLHNTSHTVVIEIKDAEVLNNEIYLSLLEGICQNTIIDQRTEYIVVKDGKSCVLEDIGENGKTYETEMGVFSQHSDNEIYRLFLGDDEIFTGTPEEYTLAIRLLDGKEEFDYITFNYLVDNNGNSINDSLVRK